MNNRAETLRRLLHSRERVLVFDGAMGTNLQTQDLTPDDFGGEQYAGCNEHLVLSRPAAVENVHAGFFSVGSDIVETNTFGATRIVLGEYGLQRRAYEINKKAAELARRLASDFNTSDHPRFVAGSIGPTTKLPTLGHISFTEMESAYREQVAGLLDGGVDILLVETVQDVLQAKAALAAVFGTFAERHLRIPVMVQVTVERTGTLLLGTDISAALTTFEAFDIDAIGINCATGPKEMSDHIRTLSANSPKLMSIQPNAGLPENIGGRTAYPLSPEELASYQTHFVRDLGVEIVGGCCGTTPAHLKAVVDAVADLAPAERRPEFTPSVSSLYQTAPLHIDPAPVLVGERTNANGSKRFRELLTVEDWDGVVSLAKEQVREGAHLLDVCVAYVGRNEVKDMIEVVSRFNSQINLPLMIDSTEADAIEAALQRISGRAIVNSVNLEDGEKRLQAVLPLCRKYGAAVIALTIDEEGMARTAEAKLGVARRIYDLAISKYGMRPQDLIFDTLTFTLGSGSEELKTAGIETIDGIRSIKSELPGVKTILGVSNISFGLATAARHVINSVFLHYAIEAGLDLAIVNAQKIVPLFKISEEERELARRLIFNEKHDGKEPLSAVMAYYTAKKPSWEPPAAREEKRTVEERLKQRIVDGNRTGLEKDLEEALKKYTALDIINTILLDGMRTVGELFGRGEMQLPFVLQSAETMKAAVSYLEPFMERKSQEARGTMVLATVKGDVHDIGKNLVDVILTNNGFKVINLGIKQPIESIIEAAQRYQADAIGMSGLLVKSTLVMKENLGVLEERSFKIPVVLGGAALTRRYVEEDLRRLYSAPVLYANDAFGGLHYLQSIIDGTLQYMEPAQAVEEDSSEALSGQEGKVQRATAPAPRDDGPRSATRVLSEIPKPPFYGTRIVEDIPLEAIFPYVNRAALFRGQWQVRRRGKAEAEYNEYVEKNVIPVFEEWKRRSIEERLLTPKVVYGYFPAQSEGDDLIVYSEDGSRARLRFTFPRQPEKRRLCISDYFAPKSSGVMDIVAFHAVTIGPRATEFAQSLFKSNRYAEYLYFHGLSVETTEALAEYWHKRIRMELRIDDRDAPEMERLFGQGYRGSRYSFGYPACPNLEDQVKLFELLDPGRIGLSLTEAYQLVPEQTTTAIIVHHPDAKYFNIR